MADELPFLAGSLLKWTSMEKLHHVKGRVFLLIECSEEDEALAMRKQLLTDPKLIVELIETMRPWAPGMVSVDNEKLSKLTETKDMFPYTPDK
jgi:hypothetical protein